MLIEVRTKGSVCIEMIQNLRTKDLPPWLKVVVATFLANGNSRVLEAYLQTVSGMHRVGDKARAWLAVENKKTPGRTLVNVRECEVDSLVYWQFVRVRLISQKSRRRRRSSP